MTTAMFITVTDSLGVARHINVEHVVHWTLYGRDRLGLRLTDGKTFITGDDNMDAADALLALSAD